MHFDQGSRRPARWLVLLVAAIAVSVATLAFVPHDEAGEDLDCLICKAGQARSTEVSVDGSVEPPLAETFSGPEYRAPLVRDRALNSGSPRAPPA